MGAFLLREPSPRRCAAVLVFACMYSSVVDAARVPVENAGRRKNSDCVPSSLCELCTADELTHET